MSFMESDTLRLLAPFEVQDPPGPRPLELKA